MDFTYTSRMAELKARAAELAGKIMVFEDECEMDNGLSPESHAAIKAAVLEAGLNAINHPIELGGAGLTILEQVVVQEELGRLTGALWDTVWRPANALRCLHRGAAGAVARAGYPRRTSRRRRHHRELGRLGPVADPDDGDAGRRPVRHQRREVVRHRRRRRRPLPGARHGRARERARPCSSSTRTPRACELLRTPRYMHTFVYEHPEFAFRDVEVGRRARAGRDRRRLRPDPRLVHRGAADDRRPHRSAPPSALCPSPSTGPGPASRAATCSSTTS